VGPTIYGFRGKESLAKTVLKKLLLLSVAASGFLGLSHLSAIDFSAFRSGFREVVGQC